MSVRRGLTVHLFLLITLTTTTNLKLIYLISNSFCAGTKTILERASVRTLEQWFPRDFCNVNACDALISKVERHILSGRSSGEAGKGRKACNYVSGIWISASIKSMRNAQLPEMTVVMTSLPLARVFQCLFTFALVSASRWFAEFDSSVYGEPQGNWRWNSNSRDVVASSPSFSRRVAWAPRQLAG